MSSLPVHTYSNLLVTGILDVLIVLLVIEENSMLAFPPPLLPLPSPPTLLPLPSPFLSPHSPPTLLPLSVWLISFHSGSLAFGALIIAIIQMIRIIIAYIQKKLKGKTGRIARILLCIFQCCFWLLEKLFRYINRQAYIEVMIVRCMNDCGKWETHCVIELCFLLTRLPFTVVTSVVVPVEQWS